MKLNSYMLFLLFSLSLTLSLSVFAKQKAETEFYIINDRPSSGSLNQSTNFVSPQDLLANGAAMGAEKITINLLSWNHFNNPNTQYYDDYEREKHFGPWINNPNDDTCYNTRSKVLMRDSKTVVTFKGPKNCSVDSGTWFDPYTRTVYRSSSDIQIDHLVPLKNAYTRGAWRWNFYTRCLYANYMGNSIHLISVQGSANMSKGDKSPDRWLPTNESYRCEYVRNWLLVKLIWNLELSPEEALGIRNTILAYHCPTNVYALSQKDLLTQRNIIISSMQQCSHLKPR